MVGQTAHNAIAFLLLSLGVQALPNEYFGGLFLAIALGYFAAVWMPPQDRRDMRLMISTAILVSTLAAIVHPKMGVDLPLSFVMGMAGLLSRYAIAIVLGISSRTMVKADSITDTAFDKILGETGKEKDGEDDKP